MTLEKAFINSFISLFLKEVFSIFTEGVLK
jgi:hypothetical protein